MKAYVLVAMLLPSFGPPGDPWEAMHSGLQNMTLASCEKARAYHDAVGGYCCSATCPPGVKPCDQSKHISHFVCWEQEDFISTVKGGGLRLTPPLEYWGLD